MQKLSETAWPTVDAPYIDEGGPVDPEVHQAAGTIWQHAEVFATSTLRDPAAGARLLMKAVIIVSRRRAAPDIRIDDLRSFVFQVYKHLVLAELKKQNRRREIEARWEDFVVPARSVADEIDRRILIEQLCERMDQSTRDVDQWRVLGYTFENIAQFLGLGANHVRSEFSKRMARLREQLREEARSAEERSL
jgi:DNA-directed RNA polymerase specialized sigma24 family protein